MLKSVGDRRPDQTLASLAAHRFDTECAALGKADILHLHLRCEEIQHFLHIAASCFPLNAGIDVLGILTKHHHVHVLRMFYRGRNATEVLNRPETDIEVQRLAKRHIQRPDALADRCGKRTLDGNLVGVDCFQGFIREVGSHPILGFLTCQHLKKVDGTFTLIGFLDGLGDHAFHYSGNFWTYAIALDEGYGDPVGYRKPAVFNADRRIHQFLSFSILSKPPLMSMLRCSSVMSHRRTISVLLVLFLSTTSPPLICSFTFSSNSSSLESNFA